MTSTLRRISAPGITVVLAAALTSSLAWASGAGSSAGSMASQSVGSVSQSVQGSSEGSSNSSRRDERMSSGEYRVVAVNEQTDPATGATRVHLTLRGQHDDADQVHIVSLPRAVALQHALQAGQAVRVTHRPYGLELAHAANGQAFYLMLDDDLHQGLAPRRVQG